MMESRRQTYTIFFNGVREMKKNRKTGNGPRAYFSPSLAFTMAMMSSESVAYSRTPTLESKM